MTKSMFCGRDAREINAAGGDGRRIARRERALIQPGSMTGKFGRLFDVFNANAHIFGGGVHAAKAFHEPAKGLHKFWCFLGVRVSDNNGFTAPKGQRSGGIFIGHAFGKPQRVDFRRLQIR